MYISQLPAINNFRRKVAHTTDTQGNEKIGGSWYRLTHHDECAGKKPSFHAMVFHLCNIKKLAVPIFFVATVKSSLRIILSIS
jgi:hypothetical protein